MQSPTAMMRLLTIGACAMMVATFGTIDKKDFDPIDVGAESFEQAKCECGTPFWSLLNALSFNKRFSPRILGKGFVRTLECLDENEDLCTAERAYFVNELVCSKWFSQMPETGRNAFTDSWTGEDVGVRSSYTFCNPGGVSADTPPSPPDAISTPEACGLVKRRVDATLPSMKKKGITFRLPGTYTCENVPEVVEALKLNKGQTNKVIKNQCNNFFYLTEGEKNEDGHHLMFAQFCEFRTVEGSYEEKHCTESETQNRVRLGLWIEAEPRVDCENGLDF